MGAAQVLCLEKSIPGASQKLEALGFVLGGVVVLGIVSLGVGAVVFLLCEQGEMVEKP